MARYDARVVFSACCSGFIVVSMTCFGSKIGQNVLVLF